MDIIIREENEADYKVVENVIKKSFRYAEQTDYNEHHLVSRIRNSSSFLKELSLVATKEEEIIGHILLSKIYITNDSNESTVSLALAPMAVLPAYQHKGVGKALIEKALIIAEKLQYQSVVVLGYPAYYAKFGFQKASLWNIYPPFDVPDDAFMVLELYKNALDNVHGEVQYSQAFYES